MFGKEDKPFIDLAGLNAEYDLQMFSIFLADYIKMCPSLKEVFDALPPIEQIILNYYNRLLRGESYTINDAHRALE